MGQGNKTVNGTRELKHSTGLVSSWGTVGGGNSVLYTIVDVNNDKLNSCDKTSVDLTSSISDFFLMFICTLLCGLHLLV